MKLNEGIFYLIKIVISASDIEEKCLILKQGKGFIRLIKYT